MISAMQGSDKVDTKDISKCNGIDAAQQCKMRFLLKDEGVNGQDGGSDAIWHLTRAFHMLRGGFMAWQYMLALLMEGIYELQDVLKNMGVDPNQEGPIVLDEQPGAVQYIQLSVEQVTGWTDAVTQALPIILQLQESDSSAALLDAVRAGAELPGNSESD